MRLFSAIIIFISNSWKVSSTFRPFFKNKSKDLNTIDILSNYIPAKIIEIYNKIKKTDSKRFKKDINIYDSFVNSVAEHNDLVIKINDAINKWNYEELLLNPSSFCQYNNNKYSEIVNWIKGFERKAEKYQNFIDEFTEFKENYSEIFLEFSSQDNYNEIFNFLRYEYIDLKTKEKIRYQANQIISQFNRKNNFFYVFDKHLNVESLVKKHNEIFIKGNMNNLLFDSINQRSLDEEQRKAVLTDEVSTLVVAGAGSGKTLTICGKVQYLIEELKINPTDILLLSFSKKSAEDLQQKVSKIDKELTVGTFHKIGLEVLKETQKKTFMVEDQYKAIIEAYFREEMRRRPSVLQTILKYYGLYLSSYKHEKKYKNEGEMYEDLRKSNFSTLKNQLLLLTNDINKRETIKKEMVKSFEEMAISNWYFINGIDYIYEAPYEKDVSTEDKRQYMPDFRLPKYKIYHEHFGINKEGRADQFEDLEAISYVSNMQWKRIIHQQNNTICIETYSHEFADGTIFEKLENELKNRGVVFEPLSDDQIYNALESIYEGQAFKSFINLIKTFLNLYKATFRTAFGFEELKQHKYANFYEKNRACLFLDIVKDIYLYYIDYLRKEEKIDFDDMILQSIEQLDQTTRFRYKYIIVDEFQDISVSRMKFLKKLISHGNSKLFAVGDDWQAIYRFSGCDINIFLKFSDYFGYSAITRITATHRNSQELQDIAGPFIMANPEQIDKKINSTRHLENPVQIMYYTDKKYLAFLNVLKQIAKIDEKAKVLILGRNNKDFEDISLDNRVFIDYKETNETKTVIKVKDFPNMEFSYSTVHGSKGLEEDYVIIISADDSRLGFPNKIEDDELLDMVLTSKSEYEYAEERRLWYVALTRTRNYTYIIVNNENPSIFVKEIENQCLIINPDMEISREKELLCPRCKSGRLVLRTNCKDKNTFFGCSNYPYCNYSINDLMAANKNIRCSECGDFMILKRGQYGVFYGCHNYPRCRNKVDYVDVKIKF